MQHVNATADERDTKPKCEIRAHYLRGGQRSKTKQGNGPQCSCAGGREAHLDSYWQHGCGKRARSVGLLCFARLWLEVTQYVPGGGACDDEPEDNVEQILRVLQEEVAK